MSTGVIEILIVDDHPLFRRGVRFYLETIPDLEVVGEVASGAEALEFLRERRVDVVLLDLQMPGFDGIETTRELLARDPGVKTLILTSFGGWDKIRSALSAGASGYILKDAGPEELGAAISAVAAGGSYLDARATEALLEHVDPAEGRNRRDGFPREPLSEREMEVLALLSRGLGNREIAGELVVSEKTVKTHVANIMAKLEVKNRTQAALVAIRENLVPGEDPR